MPTIRLHNPSHDIYPATPDYAHALEVVAPQRLLYVSGTMGLEADGTPGQNLDRQLDRVWHNIRTILASADMTVDNIIRVTSYLTDRAQEEANQDARMAALGGRAVPTTAIVVKSFLSSWSMSER